MVNLDAFALPTEKAKIGSFFTDQVCGLSEYNLNGLFPGSANISFNSLLA